MNITIENHVLYANGVKVQDLPKLAKAAAVSVWAVPTDYRENGFFVDVATPDTPVSIPACASSDAVKVATLELAADDGAMAAEARAERLDQVNADADALLSMLDATYPEREVLTWDQQVKEAEALQADPEAVTPLLSSLADYRDIDLQELAAKVLQKSYQYKVASGQIMGARQWVEQQLEAAETHEAVLAVPTLAARIQQLQEGA